MTTKERFFTCLKACMGDEIKDFDLDTEINEQNLGMDSLDVIEFSIELEDEFDIDISNSDVAEWETVNDILKFLEMKIK